MNEERIEVKKQELETKILTNVIPIVEEFESEANRKVYDIYITMPTTESCRNARIKTTTV